MSFKAGFLLDFNSKEASDIANEYVLLKQLHNPYGPNLFTDQTDALMPLSLFKLITDIFNV